MSKSKVKSMSVPSSAQTADSEKWSEGEKKLICEMQAEEPFLPYTLASVKLPNGETEMMYEIPECDKEEVLKKCWPFVPVPEPCKEYMDIHVSKRCRFRECNVIRYNNRNIIVSPFYLEAGGTVVDLVDPTIEDDLVSTLGIIRQARVKPEKQGSSK